MKILVVVAVALIDADDRVLIAQRPEGKALAGLWEFPGGKIDAGERPLVASGGRRRSSSRGGGWTTRLQPLAEHEGRRGGSLGAFWPHPVACEPPRR